MNPSLMSSSSETFLKRFFGFGSSGLTPTAAVELAKFSALRYDWSLAHISLLHPKKHVDLSLFL
jgi:hypothetical protein